MALRNTVAQAALQAFNAIGDLVENAVHTQVIPGAYDPATDALTTTETTFNVRGVLVREKERETDDNTEVQRTQFIVPSLDYPADFTPTPDDYLTILGTRYEINDIKQVPGKAIYTYFIRAT